MNSNKITLIFSLLGLTSPTIMLADPVYNVNIYGNTENLCIPDRTSNCRIGNDSANENQKISKYFLDNGDGTITDTRTSLIWKRCSEGQTWTGYTCSGESIGMSWEQVMPEGQQRLWPRFAGYEWILPTRDQLRTLVFCSNGTPQSVAWKKSCSGNGVKVGNNHYQRPTIDVTAFPNTPSFGFWTSSLYQGKSSEWWFVGFDNGYANWHGLSSVGRVRLLRK